MAKGTISMESFLVAKAFLESIDEADDDWVLMMHKWQHDIWVEHNPDSPWEYTDGTPIKLVQKVPVAF